MARDDEPDAELRRRLRIADATALDEWLARDYPVAHLLAAVLTTPERTRQTVTTAWSDLLGAILAGADPADLRAAVLERTALACGPLTDPAGTRGQPPHGTFEPAGDRWAGWWAEEPPAWPAGAAVGADQVVRALRRLPAAQAAMVVLHDAAGLATDRTVAILAAVGCLRPGSVHRAREAYLTSVDHEMAAVVTGPLS